MGGGGVVGGGGVGRMKLDVVCRAPGQKSKNLVVKRFCGNYLKAPNVRLWLLVFLKGKSLGSQDVPITIQTNSVPFCLFIY